MLNLKKLDLTNEDEISFMHETRFHPEVVKTLMTTEEVPYEKHVEYLKSRDNKHLFFICYSDKICVGYCQCFLASDKTWELGWVINPTYQGKGYGKASVGLLLKEVVGLGGDTAELVVLKNNIRAISIYLSYGFKFKEQDLENFWRMDLCLKNIT